MGKSLIGFRPPPKATIIFFTIISFTLHYISSGCSIFFLVSAPVTRATAQNEAVGERVNESGKDEGVWAFHHFFHCSLPTFPPFTYSKVDNVDQFNLNCIIKNPHFKYLCQIPRTSIADNFRLHITSKQTQCIVILSLQQRQITPLPPSLSDTDTSYYYHSITIWQHWK